MRTIQYYLFKRALEEENIPEKGIVTAHHIPSNRNGPDIYPFVFPKSFLKEVEKLDSRKEYDYFFAGTISGEHRQFLKEWDKPRSNIKTTQQNGFIHPNNDPTGYYGKNFFNKDYFQQLKSAKFSLCPPGCSYDINLGKYTFAWTYRFWEACLCGSIPITDIIDENWHKDYKVYKVDDKHIYREDWVEHNYNLVKQRHFIWIDDLK